jgi:hypothetical protein
MKTSISKDAVVVSSDSLKSKNPCAIVDSNADFVNALFEEQLKPEEISKEALYSYYVAYYVMEVENGGLGQFVFNSGEGDHIFKYVAEGLQAMKADRHLKLFSKVVDYLERNPDFSDEYLDSDSDEDELDVLSDRFFELCEKKEDLWALNGAWLKGLPNLVAVTKEEMMDEARRRGEALPDREERIAEACANEPEYVKLILALCERAGQTLSRVTAGDPSQLYNGSPTIAWYFITDQGLHHMIEAGGKAIMFKGESTTKVCEVDASCKD